MVMSAVLLLQGLKKKDLNLGPIFNTISNRTGFNFMCQFGGY